MGRDYTSREMTHYYCPECGVVVEEDATPSHRCVMLSATVAGIRYDIPEAWAIGFCLAHGGDARDAALAWHEQTQLEAQRS